MKKNNIFIEGIQGTGKTSLLLELRKELPDYQAYMEGDLSPAELSWCSYMTKEQYGGILEKYPSLASEIERYTLEEGEKKIIAYTRILTDIPGFHRDMEQYEIYNGRVDYRKFCEVILGRYQKMPEGGNLFECSFFQNTIETMLLYYQMEEKEILDFYKRAFEILKKKNFLLLYLDTQELEETILRVKKERVDTGGREVWFSMMMEYLENSPLGKARGLRGMEGLLYHLERRKILEGKIIKEILCERACVLQSRSYDIKAVSAGCREWEADHGTASLKIFSGCCP